MLNKLSINTLEELITFYPTKYQVIAKTDMLNVENEQKVIIDGVIETKPILTDINKKLKKITFRINTNQNIYNIVIFNQSFHKIPPKCL